jgi:hypothetical protein
MDEDTTFKGKSKREPYSIMRLADEQSLRYGQLLDTSGRAFAHDPPGWGVSSNLLPPSALSFSIPLSLAASAV